jgi:hypothetical protein
MWRTNLEEVVSGNIPDISEDSQFEFYECIWYCDLADFPNAKKSLGRCLGDNYTTSMAFRILKANGQVIVRKPVWSLKVAELDDIKVQAEIAVLDEGNLSRIGDKSSKERNLEEFPEVPIDFFGAKDDDKGLMDDLQEPA